LISFLYDRWNRYSPSSSGLRFRLHPVSKSLHPSLSIFPFPSDIPTFSVVIPPISLSLRHSVSPRQRVSWSVKVAWIPSPFPPLLIFLVFDLFGLHLPRSQSLAFFYRTVLFCLLLRRPSRTLFISRLCCLSLSPSFSSSAFRLKELMIPFLFKRNLGPSGRIFGPSSMGYVVGSF